MEHPPMVQRQEPGAFGVRLAVAWIAIASLAGCLGTPDGANPTPTNETDPAGPTVILASGASNDEGPRFTPATLHFSSSTVVRIINQDESWHRLIAYEETPPQPPGWAVEARDIAAGHDHGANSHDGHLVRGQHNHDQRQVATGQSDLRAPGDQSPDSESHTARAAAGSAAIFDIELNPQDAMDVEVQFDGLIVVHSANHPQLQAHWHGVPTEEQDYPVDTNSLYRRGAWNGETGGEAPRLLERAWEVNGANLAMVKATLLWDDSQDDVAAEAGNEPDTLRLTLLDPDGAAAQETEATARMGRLEILHETDLMWPREVTALGQIAARDSLPGEDPTGIGTWTLRVELLAAPGATPEEVPGTPGGPGFDGHQTWLAYFEATQNWPSIGTEETHWRSDYPDA